MSMIVNRRDIDFLLYEVLDLTELLQSPRYASYDRVAISTIFDLAQRIAEEKYHPCAAEMDRNEPVFEAGSVRMGSHARDALKAYADAGLFSAGFDAEVGGSQLPAVVSLLISGLFSCANAALAAYSFLTIAAANLLNTFGSDWQRSVFLPPMLEGRWLGTMCLSEPQAGSSLSDIRTEAHPVSDGQYRINGTKMWISAGDHQLSENIVHMVLARTSGRDTGVKGISLFIVPKFRVHSDGSIAEFNNVVLAGLNHKMGMRGITNTILNFGESGECTGFLVGEADQGLKYMFHMMNEARLGVGHAAVMSGLAGYLFSLDYARNRPQGRLPRNKNPSAPPVMIVEHADVKRMLLAQKAYVEGGLALTAYCAYLIDLSMVARNPNEIEELTLLLDLLTPVAKSWPSEFCLKANEYAIQVLGGYGYSREYPVERIYRDNRLNHIHEGTHGIQAIDVLGRKVRMRDGRAFQLLMSSVMQTVDLASRDSRLAHYADALARACLDLQSTTESVLACPDPDLRLANATSYLDALGHVVVGWLWLRQAMAASTAAAAENTSEAPFYRGKLAACRYFFTYELPKVAAQLQPVRALDDTFIATRVPELTGS